jgi:hypothetical protein
MPLLEQSVINKPAYSLKIFSIVFFFFLVNIYIGAGQSIIMKGRIMDDASVKSVSNIVAMAVRLSDSVLVKFSRSDSSGFFRIENLPVDTYQVVFSHPDFGDRTFIIMGNKGDSVVDFKNVSMPIKSLQIAEVTIFGFASPVYFKGDTLIYAADSFKVKPNAVVEDLLKKLPGIRVDKSGKIFAQGEQVDKVLVDGDEFFGKDPTIATKNLPANSVESVQVYDKKSESPTEGSKETEKIMNLKLKDDFKKGYFGKITGAGDFNKFYEEQVLLNRFKGKQKISFFSLGSNTLNSQLSWEDMDAYNLYGEDDFQYSEEDDMGYFFNNNTSSGIPQTLKNGLYFTDQIFKKTKLAFNYTNTNSSVLTKREVSSRYLFTDTSYQTARVSNEKKFSETNAVNISINQEIDSLTTLTLTSNFKYDKGTRNYNESNRFISSKDELKRETKIDNIIDQLKYDIKSKVSLVHDFKKKSRKLALNYSFNINNGNLQGVLNSNSNYFPIILTDKVNQEKTSKVGDNEHKAEFAFTEPLNKKIKAELSFDYTENRDFQDKEAFDFFNGSYVLLNDSLTNKFENDQRINRTGLKFTYDIKKKTFYFGVRIRHVSSERLNVETQQNISQTVRSILPYVKFRYNFSDNSRVAIGYLTTSKQPELNQLQPLRDNTDPNFVHIGNPDLLPAYNHIISANYNFFKPVSGNSMWSTLKFTNTNNGISNFVSYDSSGRSITQPINVKGNYNGNANINYSFSLFSKRLEMGPDINSSYSNISNIINGKTNNTKSLSFNGGLYATIHADSDAVEINLYGTYGNTFSNSSIGNFNNKTFTTGNYNVSVSYEITKKWTLSSNIDYTYKTQAAGADNVSVYIWGAEIKKKFFMKENLILSIAGYDLLNQNINAEQNINDNVISYTKSNTVGRYILLKAVYKFNSNKTPNDEE